MSSFILQTESMIFSGLNNDLLTREGLVALDMKVRQSLGVFLLLHYCTPNNYQDIHEGKDDTVWFLLLKIRQEQNNKNSVPARVILSSGHWSGSSRNRLLFDGDMTLFFLRLL
jgi:hypothetical protein